MLSFLLSFSLLFASAQQVEVIEGEVNNLQLSQQLIYAHPSWLAGDYEKYAGDLLTAIEIDYTSPLLNEATLMLSVANNRTDDMLSSTRLGRLIELLDGGIASDYIIGVFQDNLNKTRYQIPERLPFRGDLFASWISNWRVMQPLGDLNYQYPLDQAFELPSRTDASLWTPRQRDANRKTLDPSTGTALDDGLGVAASFFKSETGAALLDFYCDEAVKLWVNDVLIFDHISFDIYSRPTETLHQIQVASGWNEIVVCYAVDSYPQMGARILDLNGDLRAVKEWRDANSAPTLASRGNFTPLAVSLYPELNTSDALNSIRKLSLLSLAGDAPNALLVDEPQEMSKLHHAAWLRALYNATNSAEHFDASIQRQMVDEVFSSIEESGYYLDNAYASEINRLLDEDQKDDALELCESLLQSLPDNSQLQILHALCRSYFDYSFALTRSELEALTRKYPQNATAWNILLQQAKDADNPQRRIGLLRQRLQFTGIGHTELINALLAGNPTQQHQALLMIERLQDESPSSSTAKGLLLTSQRLHNDKDSVAAHFKADSDKYPLASFHLTDTITAMLAAEQRAAAIALLPKLAALDPSNYLLRQWQQEFGLTSPCDVFFDEFAPDVDAALATRSGSELDAQFSTTLLLDSSLYYVYSDSSYTVTTHVLTQINNKQGALDSSTQAVSGTPQHMRVIKPDGKVLEAHQVDDSWVLPALEPGDVIDSKFEYSVIGTPGLVPGLGQFTLQAFNTAYDLSSAIYFIDDALHGEFRIANFDDQQIIENYNGGTVHLFENRNAPALIPESFMPDQNSILPNVNYGTDYDLKLTANQLYHWLLNLSQCPADIEAQLVAWLDELNPQGDEHQRATQIYWAVQDLISSFDAFNDIIDTFTLGQGRPIGLLTKLFELNGINHQWVFIAQQAPHLRAQKPVFANGSQYQIPALRLPPLTAAGEPLWVFAIEHYAPLGMASEAMYGAEALVTTRDSHQLITFIPQIPSDLLNNDADIHFHIRDDGSAKVNGEIHMRVMQGAMLRRQLKQISPDQLAQAKLQFAGQFVQGLDVSGGEFIISETDDDHLFHYKFSGSIPKFVQARGERFGGRLRFPLSTAIHAQLGKAERNYDFELAIREFNKVKVRVTTEGAYSMNYGPESRTEALFGFNYDIQIDKSPSEINFEINTRFDGLKIPKENFAEFLGLLQELEKQEKRMLEFIPVEVAESAVAEQ